MRRLAPLLGLLAIAAGAASPASAQTTASSPAATTLARCVQAGGDLSVLVLMDESGSLRTTDPDDRRVEGLQAALTGLERLADPVTGGTGKPAVSVLFAGFSGSVHPVPNPDAPDPWRQVEPGDIGPLLEEAERYLTRDFSSNTDYGIALRTARELLARRSAAVTKDGGAAPCKALVWFTDGKYQIKDRQAEVEAGKRELCRPGGLMDGLVRDGVVTFTVALAPPGLGDLTPEDGRFLDALTTGGADGGACGTILSPQTGEYIPVTESDTLLFVFAGLFDGSAGDSQPGSRTFRTVPGLRRFVVLAATAADGSGVEVTGPDGQTLQLRPGDPDTATVGGARLRHRGISKRSLEIVGDLPRDTDDWVGEWSLRFSPEQSGRSQVRLFADASPTLVGRPTLVRDRATAFEVALLDAEENPATAKELVGSAKVTARVFDPETSRLRPVELRQTTRGRFAGSITIPDAQQAAYVVLDLEATFSAPPGVQPEKRSFNVPTALAAEAGYPTVSPRRLDLAAVIGTRAARAELVVTGNRLGGGCVWIEAPRLQLPGAGNRLSMKVTGDATSAPDCLRLKAGERREITVDLSPEKEATGSATGFLRVHLVSDIARRDRAVALPARFEMLKEGRTEVKLLVLIALLVLGLAIPLVLLHLLNRRDARIPAPVGVLMRVYENVEVTPGVGVKGTDEAAYHDFDPARLYDDRRGVIDVFEVETVASGRLRDARFSLFTGPYAVATEVDGHRFVAGGEEIFESWENQTFSLVPIGLRGVWLFRPDTIHAVKTSEWDDPADQAPERVVGRLVLLIGDHPDIEQGRRLLGQAQAILTRPDTFTRLRPGQRTGRLARHITRLADVIGVKRSKSSPEPTEWPDQLVDLELPAPRPGDFDEEDY
jgi:hypothetical protein